MTILNDRKEQKRFGKFAIVGILGAVIDFGVFNLLSTILKVDAVPASVVSFSLAVVNNFVLNRIWTFPDTRSTPVSRQLVQFAIVSVIGLLIRTPLFSWLEKQLVPLAARTVPNLFTPTFVGHNLALAIAIGVVMLWNFIANRYWTFNPDRQPVHKEERL
jgi:putative flippase GtrA